MPKIKTFSELAWMLEAEQRAECERTRLKRIERKQERQDKLVLGGVYRPDPVDRCSAMLLAKAPWWAHSPSVNAEHHKENRTMGSKVESVAVHAGTCLQFGTERVVEKDGIYNTEEVAAAIIRHFENVAEKEPCRIAKALLDARAAIDEGIKDVGVAIDQFDRVMNDSFQSVRTRRMAIVSECASSINALKDVRQFFLGPNYEREQKRLADFVDLCERLGKLKDSGFLDTVADTMIRLASYDKQTE